MMFQPTALLVMTHNVTGLRYFCKTSRLDELCYYKGSGVYWKRHLRKHGRNVSVDVIGVYHDKQECMDVAKQFSQENMIGANPAWANLIPENGLDGAPSGELHPMFGKPSPCKGQKRPWVGKSGADNPMWGKSWSDEQRKQATLQRTGKRLNRPLGSKSGMKGKAYPEAGKLKLSIALTGRVSPNWGRQASEETKAKMSASQKARANSFETHPNTGRIPSEETRAKMAAAKRNQVQSEETKRKRSESIVAWHKQRKESLCQSP
jgi:hypothetical protein